MARRSRWGIHKCFSEKFQRWTNGKSNISRWILQLVVSQISRLGRLYYQFLSRTRNQIRPYLFTQLLAGVWHINTQIFINLIRFETFDYFGQFMWAVIPIPNNWKFYPACDDSFTPNLPCCCPVLVTIWNIVALLTICSDVPTSLGVMCHIQVFWLSTPIEDSDWGLQMRTPNEDSDWGLLLVTPVRTKA